LKSVRFQTGIPDSFKYCVTLDMFYIQLIVLIVDFWKINKISNFKVWHPRCVLITVYRECID